MFLKDLKGQGAIEYLLIIGGAILLAAIVISVIAGVSKEGRTTVDTTNQDYNGIIQQGKSMLTDTN